jgi:hypothetical protein
MQEGSRSRQPAQRLGNHTFVWGKNAKDQRPKFPREVAITFDPNLFRMSHASFVPFTVLLKINLPLLDYFLQCFVGPDSFGPIVTPLLIAMPTLGFLFFAAPELHPIIGVFVACNAVVTLSAYAWCAGSDPGIVYADRVDQEKGDLVMCGKCDFVRPTNARHCYICGVCIEDLDHHCPWIGKCVGKYTIHAFYVFVGSLGPLAFVVWASSAWWAASQKPDNVIFQLARSILRHIYDALFNY